MDINRNNYEAYLLDLMEGRLSVPEKQRIREFLRLNPDCNMAFEEEEPWVLEAEELLFPGKEALKREFPHPGSENSESNFDLFSIGRMEGDLTPRQERDHQEMVESDPLKGSEWRQWKHTRLPALPVEYREKGVLKRRSVRRRGMLVLGMLSSAAAAALLFFLLRVDPDPAGIQVADGSSGKVTSVIDPTPAEWPEEAASEEETGLQLLTGESLDMADSPVPITVKKDGDTPLEVYDRQEHAEEGVSEDTPLLSGPKKVEPRPLRLAIHYPVAVGIENSTAYDRIRPLDIPPSDPGITPVNEHQAVKEHKAEKEISFWSIANAGIKGINKITGAEMSLMAARDEKGDLSGFQFKSKRFTVSSPIEKSE